MFMFKELISIISLDLNWSDIHCEGECFKYVTFFYVGYREIQTFLLKIKLGNLKQEEFFH